LSIAKNIRFDDSDCSQLKAARHIGFVGDNTNKGGSEHQQRQEARDIGFVGDNTNKGGKKCYKRAIYPISLVYPPGVPAIIVFNRTLFQTCLRPDVDLLSAPRQDFWHRPCGLFGDNVFYLRRRSLKYVLFGERKQN
jgi:hypothetical protein